MFHFYRLYPHGNNKTVVISSCIVRGMKDNGFFQTLLEKIRLEMNIYFQKIDLQRKEKRSSSAKCFHLPPKNKIELTCFIPGFAKVLTCLVFLGFELIENELMQITDKTLYLHCFRFYNSL